MSAIIVCVNNSLKYDMRVLRQAETFSEVFDKVIVCARPTPDRTEHFQAENVEWLWFDGEGIKEKKRSERIRGLAEKYGLYEEIASFAPMLTDNSYEAYEGGVVVPGSIESEMEIQELLMSHSRWDEVREGIPAEADDEEQLYWIRHNLDLMLEWADFIAGREADVIYCNDFDTLLCGVAHKKIHGSRLVYDEHDLYGDAFPGLFPRMYRYFIVLFEYAFLGYADAVISVSESATEWVAETYGLVSKPMFVPNCKDAEDLPPAADRDTDSPTRLYFSGLATEDKGLEKIIEAVRGRDDAVLNLRCLESEYVSQLRESANRDQSGLGGKVVFLEPVPPQDVVKAAHADGDVGLTILGGPSSVGTRNTITNKLIECLTAGLPVIVSAEMRDQSRIVKEYNAGFVIGGDIAGGIGQILDTIKKDPAILKELSENARKASQELFRWETYRDRFVDLVTGENEWAEKDGGNKQKELSCDELKAELALRKKISFLILEDRRGAARQLADMEAEKSEVEKELAKMASSKAWRIGRLFTSPARILARKGR